MKPLSIYARTGCGNPTAGLDFPWGGPGHVCQQPSQWAPHHGRPLPAEPLVGSEQSAWYPGVHCVRHLTGTKQVGWHLLIRILLQHRKTNIFLVPWSHYHCLFHLYSLGLHFLLLSHCAIFTDCFPFNCVLHSCRLHLSHSPQGSHISGFIWLQWNLGGHADGCLLCQRKLVLVAVAAKYVHVYVVVSVLLKLISLIWLHTLGNCKP